MADSLRYHFHGAALAAVELGPRRAVTLTVALDLPGRMGDHMALIRFGGITNFEDVKAFFERLPSRTVSGPFVDRISSLDYERAETRRPNWLAGRVEMETFGPVIIRCRDVASWRDDGAPNSQSDTDDGCGELDTVECVLTPASRQVLQCRGAVESVCGRSNLYRRWCG